MLCHPEHIDSEMRKLFGRLSAERFLRGFAGEEFARRAAHLVAELNAIHPFREGNGRTQLIHPTLLAARAGRPLALERMDPAAMVAAMVQSFEDNEKPLVMLINR
jgi:cell filamentation protein